MEVVCDDSGRRIPLSESGPAMPAGQRHAPLPGSFRHFDKGIVVVIQMTMNFSSQAQ